MLVVEFRRVRIAMNDLSTLLGVQREAILAALADQIPRTTDRPADAAREEAAALFDAVSALLENGPNDKRRAWVQTQCSRIERKRLEYAEVLGSLAAMENVLRFHVVKESAHRKDMLTGLNYVGAAIDALRRDVAVAAAPGGTDAARVAQLEESLEESETRKRVILESSLDPIITVDHQGVITEFNRAAEKIFGRKRAEVLGTRPSDVLFPPSKTAGHQNRIDRYLNAGEGSLLSKRTEVIAMRASGLPFEAELTMTINQDRGMPVLTFFVRDISSRKQAEEEQRRYAQDLERSNRELEQFAYVASHDLQEPLRKIRTFGERLKTQCGGALDELGRECLARMNNAAARMQALIDGLLTLSRVTTKGADFSTVNLTKIANEVAADLEVKIEQSGGRVDVGRLPTVEADPLQMRQLLQNLIGNALKFHKEGQPPVVEVRGRAVPTGDRLLDGEFADEEKCRITVADNGIGFDEKYLDRIFDVFQRLQPRDAREGTGVGLAICRKIAERHNGTITARSRPDNGATFIVELPVRQERQKS
ncbi:MAG TPA: ATP-binding protein [Thermoguttaceae bacterium]|nr:ATP-binding protein [Thermoguttaceae bacterium]